MKEDSKKQIGKALEDTQAVIQELERLEAKQEEVAERRQREAREQRQWVQELQAWEDSGGVGPKPKRPAITPPTVVDYGDVFNQVKRLKTPVRKARAALKELEVTDV